MYIKIFEQTRACAWNNLLSRKYTKIQIWPAAAAARVITWANLSRRSKRNYVYLICVSAEERKRLKNFHILAREERIHPVEKRLLPRAVIEGAKVIFPRHCYRKGCTAPKNNDRSLSLSLSFFFRSLGQIDCVYATRIYIYVFIYRYVEAANDKILYGRTSIVQRSGARYEFSALLRKSYMQAREREPVVNLILFDRFNTRGNLPSLYLSSNSCAFFAIRARTRFNGTLEIERERI